MWAAVHSLGTADIELFESFRCLNKKCFGRVFAFYSVKRKKIKKKRIVKKSDVKSLLLLVFSLVVVSR